MSERKQNRNIASTVLLPVLRVSSGLIEREDWFGEWTLIETWIFSDLPGIGNHQVIHRTETEALRVHASMVECLKKKLATYDRQVLVDTWLKTAIETGSRWKKQVDEQWAWRRWELNRDSGGEQP